MYQAQAPFRNRSSQKASFRLTSCLAQYLEFAPISTIMTSQTVNIILSTVADGHIRDFRYRQRQFISLHSWITAYCTDIEHALRQGCHLSALEARFVISTTLNHLNTLYAALDLKAELAAEYSIKYGHDSPHRRVPADFIYLVPETSAFFYGVLSVVGACIAAGSCCLIEVSS